MLARNFLHSEQIEIVVENKRFDGDEVDVEGSVKSVPSVVVEVVEACCSGRCF